MALIAVGAGLWVVASNARYSLKVTYTDFIAQIPSGRVKTAVISPESNANPVKYELRDGTSAETVLPREYRNDVELMRQKMVDVEIREANPEWHRLLGNAAPFLVLLALWFGMMNRLQGWPNGRRVAE